MLPDAGPTVEHRCYRKTPGRCGLLGQCHSFRGPTLCEEGVCVCQKGYCSDFTGTCYRDMEFVLAVVAPVHQLSPHFPGNHKQIVSGLCISGGGSRSAAAALGLLRALHHLGLLSNLDAISSVSGGSWAAAIYMFSNMTESQLLGAGTEPSKLTLAELRKQPPALGTVATARTSGVAVELAASGVPFQKVWLSTVAQAVLGPFGLGSLDAYMAPNKEAVERIKSRNPQFRDGTFLVPQPGRPGVLVMSGTVEAPDGYRASELNVVSLQMSPDFTGTPFYPNNSTVSYSPALGTGGPPLSGVLLGGGFVETFAFGGEQPAEHQTGGNSIRLQAPVMPMSLARAVGISSAAFAGASSQAGETGTRLNPQGNIWPVTSLQHPGPQHAITYQLGDGGNIDYTGLMALLQRGASRVVMMVNTNAPLSRDHDLCSVKPGDDISGLVTSSLADKFGHAFTSVKGLYWSQNQVFAKADFFPILCKLWRLVKAGKPQVVRQQLAVQANAWWGIQGGWTVDIIIILLDRSSEFDLLLPEETQRELKRGLMGEFPHFPNYNTIFETTDLTALTASQANLLASLTEYGVMQNSHDFKEILG